MQIGQKIKLIRESFGYNIPSFIEAMKKTFSDQSPITDDALRNIEKGSNFPRLTSLNKIAIVLGINLVDLIENTDFEKIYDTIRSNERNDFFSHDNFTQFFISPSSAPFRLSEYNINPLCRTPLYSSPTDAHYKKIVVVISGRLKLHISDEVINLYRGDTHTFDSTQSHYYENILKKPLVFHEYLTPKHV